MQQAAAPVALLLAMMFASSGNLRAADARTSGDIEEVIVTARKRPEGIQTVPLSVEVVSGEAIAERNLASVEELSETLSGVKLAKGAVADRQFIRGIGSGDNPSLEQSVGLFVDDISYGRSRFSEASMFDLERVEVLKGPQIAYFGNNAIAGAVNVVTRAPGNTFAGSSRLAYQPQFGGYTAEGAVDLPASPRVDIRLAAFTNGTNGWITDTGTDEDVPHSRTIAARGTMVWKPTDDFSARVKGQYSRQRERGGLSTVLSHCPASAPFPEAAAFCGAALSTGAAPSSNDFTRDTSDGQSTNLATEDYVSTLFLQRSNFSLSSITGYTRLHYELRTDLDATPLNLLSAMGPEQQHQISQEFRIVSGTGNLLEYVGGIYYHHDTTDVQDVFAYGFLTPLLAGSPIFSPLVPYLPLAISDQFNEVTNTSSAFGSATWKPAARVDVTSALRFTSVAKHFVQDVGIDSAPGNFGAPAAFPSALAPLASAFARGGGLATPGVIALSRRDSHWSPSISAQYRVTDSFMLYARFDDGFKAGGFNGADLTGNAAQLAFAPEKVRSGEIGMKSSILGNRLRIDVDVFRSRYSDLQLAGVKPSDSTGQYVNRVQNAGGVESRGVEIAAAAQLTATLTSNLSMTYLSDYYTRYPNATATALQTLNGLPYQDLRGQSTPFAPRFSAQWILSYRRETAWGLAFQIQNRLFAETQYALDFNNDPNTLQGGYAREDLMITMWLGNNWQLSLAGGNLTDKTIRTYGTPLPITLGTYAFASEPPRNVTLQMQHEF